LASAVAIEAEYTITRPSMTRSRAAHASDRSYSGAGWLPLRTALAMALFTRQFLHRRGEHLAAVLVVAEHVEARARGREQHCIAGTRHLRGAPDRGLKRGRFFHRDIRPGKRALQETRIPADQENLPCVRLYRRRERRKILSLALAAEDEDRGPPQPVQRRDGRADVGA